MVFVSPVTTFAGGFVAGVSGMGDALITTMFWQLLWIFAKVPEVDSMELLVLVLTFQGGFVCINFALWEWRTWRDFGWLAVAYMCTVGAFSPLGAFTRENLEPADTKRFLAWLFLVFGASRFPLGIVQKVDESPAPTVTSAPPRDDRFAAVVVDQEAPVRDQPVVKASSPQDTVQTCLPEAWFLALLGALPCPSLQRRRQAADEKLASYPRTAASRAEGVTQKEEEEVPQHSAGKERHDAEGEVIDALPLEKEGNSELSRVQGTEAPDEIFDRRRIRCPLLVSGSLSGFLSGLCGLPGPPYIVFVSLFSVPKSFSRPMFPVNYIFEIPIRLATLLSFHGVDLLTNNIHVILFSLMANLIGLHAGKSVYASVSQLMFERLLLGLLLLTAVMILGITTLDLQGVVAVLVAIVIFVLRYRYLHMVRRKNDAEQMPERETSMF